ncbi:hypothetical protein HD806DRAFT_520091 [Xylariaceae sp. AK1471]|nr:hypothetical protein HD806DRAFT_520091 [Xylariaceae sp. AK1471]
MARLRFRDVLLEDERGVSGKRGQSLSVLRSRAGRFQHRGSLAGREAIEAARRLRVPGLCRLLPILVDRLSGARSLCRPRHAQPLAATEARGSPCHRSSGPTSMHTVPRVGGDYYTPRGYTACRGGLIKSSFFRDTGLLENGVGSPAWTAILIVLSAVVPFILYKMDSFRCISLSPAQTRSFPMTLIATALIMRAWNVSDELFAKGQTSHCGYTGNHTNWVIIDLQLCAFTPAT